MVTQSEAVELTPPVSEKDHVQGPVDAPLTLVEYGDYECEYCGSAYPMVQELQSRFGDRLRFVFRHFPHASIHPHASIAAQAAEAAGAQGKFWQMHEMLFKHQKGLAGADLIHYALQIGLEPYRIAADLATEVFARRVNEQYQSGQQSGVMRTPTFFINGRRFDGERDLESLAAALEAAGR
ncbi:MAG: cyclic nucleotide-binding protein [Phycisphaerales bacterium]|nr:cyclic nucleotide-binding protein [Phycisphaerales bacterium]